MMVSITAYIRPLKLLKHHRLGGLNNRNIFLTVLEAGSLS